jgi:hypothetical protein
MLTKSLHTATAVANVAMYILSTSGEDGREPTTREGAIVRALGILGYCAADFAADDATVTACHSTLARMLRRAGGK